MLTVEYKSYLKLPPFVIKWEDLYLIKHETETYYWMYCIGLCQSSMSHVDISAKDCTSPAFPMHPNFEQKLFWGSCASIPNWKTQQCNQYRRSVCVYVDCWAMITAKVNQDTALLVFIWACWVTYLQLDTWYFHTINCSP